jgi:hypothetical protein
MVALPIIVSAGGVYSQDSSKVDGSRNNWTTTAYIETGYTNFALGDARSLFDQVLNDYRRIYISLPAQSSFSGNMLIGGSVLFTSDIPVRIGFGGYYSKTASASSYKDFSGTLLERMDVNMMTVHLTVELAPFSALPRFYVYAHPGVSYALITYSEDVNMTYPSPQSSGSSSSGYAFTIEGDVGLGFRTSISGFPVAIEAGYREGKTGQLTDTSGLIQVPLDISGLVVRGQIGINL